MNKSIFIILALFLSGACHSYGAYNGKIKDVRIDRSGLGIITFDGLIGGDPASCASASYKSSFSFNATTDGGKAIYALALAAAASGMEVSAIGTGDCGEYVNIVESLSYWHIIAR